MGTRDSQYMDEIADGVSEGGLVVDGEWTVTDANAAAATLLDASREQLEGADVREAIPRSVKATFHHHFEGEGVTPESVAFEEYFPQQERWFAVRTEHRESEGLLVFIRDVTEMQEYERELESREEQLKTLSRINGIIHEIIEALVGATTREGIERTVCERIAENDLYEFAWIGERDASGDRLRKRTVAGEEGAVVERIVEGSADESSAPERASVETSTAQVVEQLANDARVPEGVQREAFALGLQSGLAVPLVYGQTVYGVLGVYAAREDAFSDRERTGFETLGETIGLAINAARQRNLLLSDTVIELSFRLGGESTPFVVASSRLECTATVEGTVPLDEDTLLCYVLVEDGDPEEFRRLATDSAADVAGRVIDEHDTGGLLEIPVTGSSVLSTLSALGGTVREASFEDGSGRLVAEFPPDQDVRAAVEQITAAAPGTELVSRHERERSVETAQDFRSSLDERLTEKQRRAIRTAYLADYFQSPRGSTAEDVAASLGVTPPTLHYHLRAAQRKLLDSFFGDEADPPRPRDRVTDG